MKEAAMTVEVTRGGAGRALARGRAHGEYEQQLGGRDEDWPDSDAGYILDKLSGA
jgi:hypothetical protein